MRYRNNSQYKNDTEIRKRAYVSQAVLSELKRIIEDSEVRLTISAVRGCSTRPKGMNAALLFVLRS